jgi:DNA repair exonuclease SbcCD ATPase subunit
VLPAPRQTTRVLTEQRFKGAIDARIAEEQARQRQAAASGSPQRGQPRRRGPGQQDGRAPRVSSRQREPPTGNAVRTPNPSDFEPAFSIGGDDSLPPSRVSTPLPEIAPREAKGDEADEKVEDGPPVREDAATEARDTNGTPDPAKPLEVTADVRTKLRKLERIESKYGELLKAYRVVHSRVQAIEPFEATLREYTPLTSIGDPASLVEYLGQITTKGDMVLDELKRVSSERDELKQKAQEADKTIEQLRTEVSDLKLAAVSEPKASEEPVELVPETTGAEDIKDDSQHTLSPAVSVKSPSSISARIPSLSLFSPRAKPTSPPAKDTTEDLFSYDSEVPRLEKELQSSQGQIEELKQQLGKVRGDLTVARESTEGMAVSLESATRELQELRESKDKFESEKGRLQRRIDELVASELSTSQQSSQSQNEMNEIRGQISTLKAELEQVKQNLHITEEAKTRTESELEAAHAEIANTTKKLAQKDSELLELGSSLAAAKQVARDYEERRTDETVSEKKIGTMQAVMDTLRSQLKSAEATINEVRTEMAKNEAHFNSRPSTKVFGFFDDDSNLDPSDFKSREDVVAYISKNFGAQKETSGSQAVSEGSGTKPPAPTSGQGSKKSNKKKKKGKGKGAAAVTDDVEIDEPAVGANEVGSVTPSPSSDVISKLEKEIAELKEAIQHRDSSIERLSKQLKDQEALQEEIETLRDDLLHQGEEHVEARDRLKVVESERKALVEKTERLEAELLELQKAMSARSAADEDQKNVAKELAELKIKSTSLKSDLTAAEQLAATRFKDLSDLRELLSKAQPELKSLRAEIAELKKAKEDLKNKEGELKRMEARHEDLKAEMKGFGKRLSDKDAEVKELQQKIEQETSTRTRAEEDLRTTESQLRTSEARRQEATAASKESNESLRKSREEITRLKTQLSDLEDRVATHDRQVTELREEVTLKAALHSSSQSLVQSLRDQTHELNTQAREASTRAENLEEELAEAQRMLSERTREGQTMRMLLNQSETGTESRVREMKERMDAAIEERDRVEDEASVSSRRMIRELDEAKSKAREAQRALKILEDEKDELNIKQRDSKRRLNDLEQASERASKEVEDVRAAMAGLREALNESERQVQNLETQRIELRKAGVEAKDNVDKLTKSNKALSDEVKTLQSGAKKQQAVRPGLDSGLQSSRASTDSTSARSPAPATREKQGGAPPGLSQGTVDYVYLKNVLLQFLEQKDKAHQRQLIPVLGMLLHFDRYVSLLLHAPLQPY